MYDTEEDEIYLRAISGMQLTSAELSFKKQGVYEDIFEIECGFIHLPLAELAQDDVKPDCALLDAAFNSKTRN